MLFKIKEFWDKYSFEIILIGCAIIVIALMIWRKFRGEKGTWAKSYYYPKGGFPATRSFSNSSRVKHGESKGELECRRVLEKIFKQPFPSQRPDFLRNPVTGGAFNLELDCYNAQIGLAVEYNGVQHYKYVPYFHRNKEAFYNQKYRDDMKSRLCKEKGIYLIEVPYTVKVENIEAYLIKQLKNFNQNY